jgi:hypothetical protein
MNKKIILIFVFSLFIFSLFIFSCKAKNTTYQRSKYDCTDNQSRLSQECADNCDKRNITMTFEECADTCMYIYCKQHNRE